METETFTPEENAAWEAFAQALPTYTLDDLPHPDIFTFKINVGKRTNQTAEISLYKRDGQWYPVQNEAWHQYLGNATYETRSDPNGGPILITTRGTTGDAGKGITFGIATNDDSSIERVMVFS